MFDENGFDATTVDDIAAELGMSARSFFRYFPVKEDVVIGDPTPIGMRVRDAASARPIDEPIWAVLPRSAPATWKSIAWAAMLEPVIVERLGGPEDTGRSARRR